METTTINAGNVQTRGAFPLKEWAKAKINSVNLWLNAKSLFYSNICQYSVSRRTVLRVNMVTAAMLVGAVCVCRTSPSGGSRGNGSSRMAHGSVKKTIKLTFNEKTTKTWKLQNTTIRYVNQ